MKNEQQKSIGTAPTTTAVTGTSAHRAEGEPPVRRHDRKTG
jgi:hypothetical protein